MNKKISVVFPVYNEENNLDPLYKKVAETLKDDSISYELIFVDNGSTDDSLEKIKQLRVKDPRVYYISLSRNFGHQNAIYAGLTYSRGDAVITMDADLQHPPDLIPKMIQQWKQGYHVVYTTKHQTNVSLMHLMFVKLFYWLLSRISKIKLHFGQSDFRLLDRKAVQAVLNMPEYHKFLRGQVQWIGFKQMGLPFNVQPRHDGKSKFSYRHLFLFALDAIFSFSRYPLHLFTLFGIGIALLSCVYIVIEVFIPIWVNTLGWGNIPMPPGWATLTVAIFFLGSVQLIAIGVVGEYIGRIFDQAKGRPNFLVQNASSFEERIHG